MGFSDRASAALGEAVHRRGGPLVDDLLHGMTAELDLVDALIGPTARGWSPVLDLDLTPWPAWLGQATGRPVPGYITDLEEQRDYVRARMNSHRGSVRDLADVLWPLLTGTQSVGITERWHRGAWRVLVVVFDSETTRTVAQLQAAALDQKPVGTVLTIQLVADAYPIPTRWYRPGEDLVSYARMSELQATYPALQTAHPTYADATNYQEP